LVGDAVGYAVGALVGDAVGYAVGALVGDAVGYAVGYAVGALVGEAVGYAVGALVGDAVGYAVGYAVGALVGDAVGYAVGALVGDAVGYAVGYGVGIIMHSVRPVVESAVHVPVAQSTHALYSVVSWYLPDGQWSQDVDARPSANLPAWHDLHDWPVVSWYVPTSHPVHSVAVATAYLPLLQVSQDAAFDVVEIEPCAQLSQRPSLLYRPATT
jgi:hypothetical protein